MYFNHQHKPSSQERASLNNQKDYFEGKLTELEVRFLAQRKDFDERLLQVFTAAIESSEKLSVASAQAGDERLKEYIDKNTEAILEYLHLNQRN